MQSRVDAFDVDASIWMFEFCEKTSFGVGSGEGEGKVLEEEGVWIRIQVFTRSYTVLVVKETSRMDPSS